MKSVNQKVVIVTILILTKVSFAGTYSGGLGTPADPFEISSVADWQQLMTHSGDWASNFKLVADINLAGVTLTPVGNSTTPFNGAFYGNFHVVRNATINLPSNHFVGLFGFVQLGGITDLGVVGTNIQGLDYVGGLVGEMSSDGTITNCYTTGSVFGTSSYVGGLVGYNYGTISSCYSTALASGYYYVGGLVGMYYYSVNGKITNCYATGVAYGVNYIAGLVGYDYSGTIINCYATGQVIGNAPYVTGLVGVNY
jgi:The GLUG motif.